MLVQHCLKAATIVALFVHDGKAFAPPVTSRHGSTRRFLLVNTLFASTSTEQGQEITSFEGVFVPDVNQPLPKSLLSLPRHSHAGVNEILCKTEATLKALHRHSQKLQTSIKTLNDDHTGPSYEKVFANSYVDLGKVDTIGFDYDYTLVTYTEELLELIYDMALRRLVHDRQYPLEMLDAGLKFNPRFSIRGTNMRFFLNACEDSRNISLFLSLFLSPQVWRWTKRLVGFVTCPTHTRWRSHGRDTKRFPLPHSIGNIEANEPSLPRNVNYV